MAERAYIPNSLDLAQQVAGIIVRDSYKAGGVQSCIQDVLLFGSTLNNKPAHDIDLLVIHQHAPLNQFGFATLYNEHTAELVPHPTANLIEKFYRPEAILESLGGAGIYDFSGIIEKIDAAAHEQLRESTSITRVPGDQYLGKLELPYIGEIEWVKPVPFQTVLDSIKRAVDEKLRSKMVSTKMNALMNEHELDMDSVLDLHVMDARLLFGELPDERKIIVAQCQDPTFWNTVLTTGRLYSCDSGKFEIPLEQRYPSASQVFPH